MSSLTVILDAQQGCGGNTQPISSSVISACGPCVKWWLNPWRRLQSVRLPLRCCTVATAVLPRSHSPCIPIFGTVVCASLLPDNIGHRRELKIRYVSNDEAMAAALQKMPCLQVSILYDAFV
jgi:hypothetical protein